MWVLTTLPLMVAPPVRTAGSTKALVNPKSAWCPAGPNSVK